MKTLVNFVKVIRIYGRSMLIMGAVTIYENSPRVSMEILGTAPVISKAIYFDKPAGIMRSTWPGVDRRNKKKPHILRLASGTHEIKRYIWPASRLAQGRTL